LGYNSENHNTQQSISLAKELLTQANSTAIYDSESFKQKDEGESKSKGNF